MPVLESVTLTTASLSMATFALSTGPKALESLHKELFKTGSSFHTSHDHALFVLKQLEDYGHLLTREEHKKIRGAYVKIIKDMTEVQRLKLLQKAPSPQPFKIWKPIDTARNIGVIRKLALSSKIREAAQKMLADSTKATILAEGTSSKGRIRHQNELGRRMTPSPMAAPGSSTATPAASYPFPYPSLDVPEDWTDSNLSTAFRFLAADFDSDSTHDADPTLPAQQPEPEPAVQAEVESVGEIEEEQGDIALQDWRPTDTDISLSGEPLIHS
ncbi:hypothetical protein B0H14DRAFT_2843864 [Mycena olivaceomarginata]|nr:hypothetical protein B0H14DRAFT_2843864 [Mycena olivaceomarginata]